MVEFFAELKRRHIYRVGAAYVVVAWALTQVIDVLSQIFDLPGSIARPAVVLLAIGFPVALIAAWMLESKPHAAITRAVHSKPTIVDWSLCGSLVAVLLFMTYQQIGPSAGTTRQTTVDSARSTSLDPAGAISVAVLPFTNLSSDPEQEFFSDGMTEEITAALAKVPDLRVVARTSAFEFKGQSRNIQNIGQQLHATHLIEGSVRKAGDRLRITVQLIKADDGTHIWSENYDRQLTDVFAIQEDIARTVTASFHMSLNLKAGENLVNNRSIDPESYQQYLRARALFLSRAGGALALAALTEANALVESVVVRNPDYAPAWILLSQLNNVTPNFRPERNGTAEEFRRVVDEHFSKSEAAARRAIQLDPNLAIGYHQLAIMRFQGGKTLEAEQLWSKAIALGVADGDFLQGRAIMLAAVGRLKEALAVRQQLLAIEPLIPAYNNGLAVSLWLDGRNEDVIAQAKSWPSVQSARILGMAYASMGRYAEAADVLASLPSDGVVKEAIRLLRTAPAKADMPQNLPALGTQLAWVYLGVGAENRVMDNYETLLKGGRLGGTDMGYLWHPYYAPVRKTERFKAFVKNAGYVDYWRARGWPQFCHPTTGDDFGCE